MLEVRRKSQLKVLLIILFIAALALIFLLVLRPATPPLIDPELAAKTKASAAAVNKEYAAFQAEYPPERVEQIVSDLKQQLHRP